uniref:Uncharacterized protein n=1 Tax=Onchocerca volvulus TaxID=6282 RepID=A0A8R1XRS4_ONCVO
MVQWSIMAGEPKENWLEDKDMEESIINVCMNMGLMEEEMPSQKVMVLIDETRFSFLLKYEKATQLSVKMAQSNITQKEIEHWV